MHQPEISVIMSVFKETETGIRVAVSSILEQTFRNFELIIVNDNPESEEAGRILEKIAKEDERIRITTNDRNRALGYSLNVAVRAAQADIIARMDTEDTSVEERLEKQYAYMRAHPSVDLLFAQWIDVDEKGAETPRLPSAKDAERLKKTFFTKSLLMHPTLMARKEVLLKNPYPEMGRPEDIVLWLKLIRESYTFDLLEEPLYKYRADRLDMNRRFIKTKKGAENVLPHLIRESRYYWHNIYFWLYFLRTLGEYLVSRNKFIFNLVYIRAIRTWKSVFGV